MEDPEADHTCSKLEQVLKKKIYIYIYIYYITYFSVLMESSLLVMIIVWHSHCTWVGIATDYGLDGPGSNPGGDEISALPDGPCGPPNLL